MSIDQGQPRARQISTMREHDVCDICGRTLLRGEHTEGFLAGARRYEVCELCKARALQEGWQREGSVPEYPSIGAVPARRRSLLGRLRRRAADELQLPDGVEEQAPPPPQTLDDELSFGDWLADAGTPQAPDPGVAERRAARAERPAASPPRRSRPRMARTGPVREPRHVHAVPTNTDHKIAAAVDVFNRTEHTRTVAGVARSLGAPEVSITADLDRSAVVWAAVSWELCWYRYEVDLSDAGENVRLDAQGYELDELAEHERVTNASADEAGRLVLL